MKLLFTGVIPGWFLVLLFLALSGLSIFLYRKHKLPKPWSFWLPATRVMVIALLILALFQPVLARYRTIVVRGRIPVVVDTSGSMWLVDTYSLSRQVDIAWEMKLFPRRLRNMVFKAQTEPWLELVSKASDVETTATNLVSKLKAAEPWNEAFSDEVDEFGDQVKEVRKEVAKIHKKVKKGIADAEYLDVPEPDVTGSISQRRYNGISGIGLQTLRDAEKYPDKPDKEEKIARFDIQRNSGDAYGVVVRGYVVPPDKGRYKFFLWSPDEAELFFSKSSEATEKKSIITVDNSTDESKSFRLKAGEAYYIEAVMKEYNGTDGLMVGWRMPDDSEHRPIQSEFIAPYDNSMVGLFKLKHDRFVGGLERHAEELEKLEEALKDLNGDKIKDVDGAKAAFEKYCKISVALSELTEVLDGAQKLADERLALAGIEKVDKGLDELSKMKRSELAKFVLLEKPYRLLERLQERGDVDVFSFDDTLEVVQQKDYTNLTGELAATRIGSTLYGVLKRYEKQRVAAFILLSDGNNNSGKPAKSFHGELVEREIPLYSLAMGSTVPPPDVAIARVISPRTSFLNDRINLSVVVKREGYLDRPIKLKVSADGEVLAEKVVKSGYEAKVVVDLPFVEKKGGMRNYLVEAETFEGEALDHNNEKRFSVNVLEDRIRTLLIDEFPRWESRYANMMLQRDRRIDLTTIFIASTKENELPVGKESEEMYWYPKDKEELFGHHIIILGDIKPSRFTTQQLVDIRDFVIKRGGTLITMAGENNMPSRYVGTPIAELLALRVVGDGKARFNAAAAMRKDEGTMKNQPLSLTVSARFDDVIQIGGLPEETMRLWNELPGMNWVHEGIVGLPGAEVLVTFDEDKSKRDNRGASARRSARSARRGVPVMAKSYVGLGKVLYLGSDSFWRWRYRARWRYHHRFWGQILLWATMGRTTGSDKYVKLMTDRPSYAPEEGITIKARLLDEEGVPISDGSAIVEVYDEEDELVKRVPLVHMEASGGEYRALLTGLSKGKYRVVPKVVELEDKEIKAEVEFDVRDLPTSEYIDLALNETQLDSVSDEVIPFEKAQEVIEKVEEIENKEEHRDDHEIWDTLIFMILVALLLGFEWQVRKKLKLV